METLNETKKINKGLLLFIFFLIVALLIFLVVFLESGQNTNNEMGEVSNEQNQGENILVDGELIDEELVSEEPVLPVLEEPSTGEAPTRLALRQNYLIENISELSPIKEVLGGTFYITGFSWSNENEVSVQYEDGHIALEADVLFDGDIAPSNFVITKEN